MLQLLQMKNPTDLPPPIDSLDSEKEKLKAKIKEILDFPVFYKGRSKEMDPRKLAEDPTWYPGRVSHLPNNMFAEIIFVILGERKASDTILLFRDRADKDRFISLLQDAGVSVGDVTEEEISDGIRVKLIAGRSLADVEKMKEVRSHIGGDKTGFDEEYGEMMGVPTTAVDAFVGKTKKYIETGASREERAEYNTKYSQAGMYGQFIYSKEHINAEHQFFLDRNAKLKEYAPQLFE